MNTTIDNDAVMLTKVLRVSLTVLVLCIVFIAGGVMFNAPSRQQPAPFACLTYELHAQAIYGPPQAINGNAVVTATQVAKLTCTGYTSLEVDGELFAIPAVRTLFEADVTPTGAQPAPQQPVLQGSGFIADAR